MKQISPESPKQTNKASEILHYSCGYFTLHFRSLHKFIIMHYTLIHSNFEQHSSIKCPQSELVFFFTKANISSLPNIKRSYIITSNSAQIYWFIVQTHMYKITHGMVWKTHTVFGTFTKLNNHQIHFIEMMIIANVLEISSICGSCSFSSWFCFSSFILTNHLVVFALEKSSLRATQERENKISEGRLKINI